MIVKYGTDVEKTKKYAESLVLFSDVLLGDYSVFYPSLYIFLLPLDNA
jgi:hypothetical protein